MSAKYFKILGVKPNASLNQIKAAFRTKAKKLHPDKNKAPDANEQFIQLNEAYEYLCDIRNGKIKPPAAANKASQPKRTAKPENQQTYEEWKKTQREKIRQMAKEQAKMRYREYVNSEEYKRSEAFYSIGDHLFYLFSWFIIIFPPYIGYLVDQYRGVLIGFGVVALFSPFWIAVFKERRANGFKPLGQSLKYIVQGTKWNLVTGFVINLFLLFKVTLNTLVPIHIMLSLIISLILIGFFISRGSSNLNPRKSTYLSLVVLPLLFNLFFLLNFLFSSNPVQETYSFTHRLERVRSTRYSTSGMKKTSFIYLGEGNYEEYPWVRLFPNYHKMKYSERITYQFEDGLFGIRVLKSYQFH